MVKQDLIPILWTRKETAKHLCCSIFTIDRLIKNGKLKTVIEFEEGKNSTQVLIVGNINF
jgi:hypothetical protein